jgi:peptidoglycan/LPS O-acetylase OafA/YrhL
MEARHRFEALDAWRGICAIVVALEHLNTTSLLRENAFSQHAYRFVDFFFVLSGFVIAHAYKDAIQRAPAGAWPFLVRRLGRLWPLHAAVLVALVAIECLALVAARAGVSFGHQAFSDRNTLGAIPANLLLVHAWGFFDHTTWNGPSWSISAEWLAYLVFAGVCALAPARWFQAAAGVLLVGTVAVVLVVAPEGMKSTYDYAAFRCLYGFMTGVLVRALWRRVPPRVGTIGEIATLVAVVAAVAWLPSGGPAVLVTPLFGAAVWVFASEDGRLSRWMRRPGPQALGAWSYSIYMVHVLVVLATLVAAATASRFGVRLLGEVDGAVAIVGPAWVTASVTGGYLGAVILLSYLTYRFIELPGQRWANRWSRGRFPRQSTT